MLMIRVALSSIYKTNMSNTTNKYDEYGLLCLSIHGLISDVDNGPGLYHRGWEGAEGTCLLKRYFVIEHCTYYLLHGKKSAKSLLRLPQTSIRGCGYTVTLHYEGNYVHSTALRRITLVNEYKNAYQINMRLG